MLGKASCGQKSVCYLTYYILENVISKQKKPQAA